jgi:hypothetical protein
MLSHLPQSSSSQKIDNFNKEHNFQPDPSNSLAQLISPSNSTFSHPRSSTSLSDNNNCNNNTNNNIIQKEEIDSLINIFGEGKISCEVNDSNCNININNNSCFSNDDNSHDNNKKEENDEDFLFNYDDYNNNYKYSKNKKESNSEKNEIKRIEIFSGEFLLDRKSSYFSLLFVNSFQIC